MSIRKVTASSLGKLVKTRAIVTQCSEVKAMVVVATYTCDQCAAEVYIMVNSSKYMPPTNCLSFHCMSSKSKGFLHLQTRASKLVKYQELVVREQTHQVPTGCIPKYMNIVCRGEVTRCAEVGDDVTITGIFLPKNRNGFFTKNGSWTFDVFIETHVSNH